MPTELRVLLDLPFATVPTREGPATLTLDVWVPRRAEPCPTIVYVHGGAWRSGTSYRPPPFPRPWEDGFGMVSLNYRFSQQAVWPAQLDDVRAGIAWVRTHGAEHGLDGSRLVLWGVSAGAHLAMCAGLVESAEAPPEVHGIRGIAQWCGPTDFPRGWEEEIPGDGMAEIVSALCGGEEAARGAVGRSASPRHLLHPAAPPHFHAQGLRDRIVPPWHAESYHEALVAAGVPSELLRIPEADHFLGNGPEAAATGAAFRRWR